MLWSIRSSLLNARSKPASRPVPQDVRREVLLAGQHASAAGRTRAPRCTSWRRRTAPCRPGTAACCPATAGGSGRCRPSPARPGGPGSASRGTPRSWPTHSSANGGRSAPVARAGPVVERVVGRGDDRDRRWPCGSSCSVAVSRRVGVDVRGVAVDGQVDVHADRPAPLLGELAEQPGGAGQQREPAQQLDRQAEVGQRRAADPGAVERQPCGRAPARGPGRSPRTAAGAARAGPPRSAMPISTGVRGSPSLCTGWPSPGTNLRCRPRLRVTASSASASQPASSVGSSPSCRSMTSCRKPPQSSVTPRNREPPPSSPAASAPCSESGRRQVGQPGRDGGRGEAVVGQRDQHRLEDPDLAGRRPAHRRPARTPARRSRPCPSGRRRGPGPAAGSRRRSRCRARSGSSGRRRRAHAIHPAASQARISSPCSSSPGGGSR